MEVKTKIVEQDQEEQLTMKRPVQRTGKERVRKQVVKCPTRDKMER